MGMVVTIRVSPETYDLLRELRDRRGARSFNRLLRELAEKELNEKKGRVIIEGEQAEKRGKGDLILEPEVCPHCGYRFQGNRFRTEILNIHLPVPKLGLEIRYPGCPACMLPLTENLTWRKTEKLQTI